MDLSRKRTREALKPRTEPYWQKLAKGDYIGFRRGPDTWVARHRDTTGRQHYQALEENDYDDAKRAAEKWLTQMRGTGGTSAKRGTVREALETYLQWLRDQGRESSAKVAEQRFVSLVWPDPLASIPLHALTRDDFKSWRDRLKGWWSVPCSSCGVVRRLSGDETEASCTKCRAELNLAKRTLNTRKPRSINRHVRAVTAALNRAHDEGHVGNPESWKLAPLADEIEEGGETAVMLTPEHRRALIAAASPEAAAFLRGLEFTGARPGELSAALVRDLDRVNGLLSLSHRKGRPAKLRVRSVVLSATAAAFLAEQARDKLPSALLFLDPEGKPWERHTWAREIRAAVKAHNATGRGKARIPTDASAYSFRHARISELLQVHGVDPLTVAQQTGTSVKMIEQAYFRFIPSAMQDKLRAAS